MGTLGFVRWLKVSYPRHFRVMLLAILLGLVGTGIWVYIEASERPTFHVYESLRSPSGRRRPSPCIGCLKAVCHQGIAQQPD